MKFKEFNELIGEDSYVRCNGKERTDSRIIDYETAKNHIRNGGTIGWWVTPGHIVVDIDEGQSEAIKAIKKLKLKIFIYLKNSTRNKK